MKTENETKIKQPDYISIRKESSRIDCYVAEADFSTSYPNKNRISYTVSDINRYLKHTVGGRL